MKFHTGSSMRNLNIETYRDKVLGCWTGKNIGGTLGTPFEGPPVTHDITFYTQDLNGEPLPNDTVTPNIKAIGSMSVRTGKIICSNTFPVS